MQATAPMKTAYVICYADGFIDNERPFHALTQSEKKLILEMVNGIVLEDNGMTIDQYWRCLEHE